jgi:hypothetical protein
MQQPDSKRKNQEQNHKFDWHPGSPNRINDIAGGEENRSGENRCQI